MSSYPLNNPADDEDVFGINSAGMNAARDRKMYESIGLFNPADDEAYFSNQGGVFFDPAIGEEVFRPYTAEEFEYLTTGQTGFKTGADSFVDYVGDGRVETGDGNRRTFYSDEGGFTDYRDITDRNAPVLTTTPDGKSAVYKDGKFITQGMPGFKDALAAALKLATGASAIKTGLTGGKRGFSAPGGASAYAMKELPQSAIRTAAAGGLMTYAGGGAIDQAAYFAANPDVAASGMSAQEHYDKYGAAEGRNTGADLTSAWNSLQGGTQADLDQFFATTTYSPEQLAAFTGYGAEDLTREMLRARGVAMPSAAADDWMAGTAYGLADLPGFFDWQKYIAYHPDLAEAGIDTKEEAERHYALFGQGEKRNLGIELENISDLQSRAYQGAQTNMYAAPTGNTDLAKKLWEQYGDDPSKLRQAAFNAGVTGGDIATAIGKPTKLVGEYMSQWLNPAILSYTSLSDMEAAYQKMLTDTSPAVSGPGGDAASRRERAAGMLGVPVPTLPSLIGPGGQSPLVTPGQLPSSAWASAPTVAPQPYPYRPSDIYNNPQYGDINSPGVNPIVSSQSAMPMGGNAVTKPYEAIRHSSRLLPEETRPGAAWARGGGQVIYQEPIQVRTAAAGGLMSLAQPARYSSGGAVDEAAYFAANPDVAASGMTAQQHYDMFGRYEGRDPGGATSGAQTHYWDSPDWLSQAGNGGGTRATGIQSSSTPVNLAGNLPGNASFYKAPGQFEGQNFSVGLSAQGWENVQRAVAGGMDFNEAVIRNSGDGIGTAVLMPADSGYLPYGVDVITGQAVMGMGTGAGSAAAPARPSGPSGGAIYNPVAQQPYPYRPSDIYNSPQYANVGDPGVNPIVSSQSPMPMGGNAVTKPYEAIRHSSRLLPEETRPGSAWDRGGGQVVYRDIRTAASGGLMGLATGGSTSQFQNDWNAFFSDAVEPGFVHDLGGGSKVTKMHDGTAIYQGPNGEWIPFDKNTNPTFLARQATGLAQDWQSNPAYQTATNAPAGSQTRLDPAASGFYFDEQGFVVQRRPEGMGGDIRFKFNINDIQDPQVKAYFQANPDLLAAHGAHAASNYSSSVLPRGQGAGLTTAQATPEDLYYNYFHGYGGVGGAASQVQQGGGSGSSGVGSSVGSGTVWPGGTVYSPVAPQPYQYNPSDIYNNPQYGDINSPGVSPIVSSQSPMPMGGNAVTKPYEAIRHSSRLLPEETRPGSAWDRGGGQVIYNPRTAASGGLMGLQNETNLGRYAGGGLGRLVQGPGDGVSDSVPAMIGGQQPALIAQGEYVLPARVVSELGNGSTEAGAKRIDQMVAKIEQMGRSAGRGKDSGAYKLLG